MKPTTSSEIQREVVALKAQIEALEKKLIQEQSRFAKLSAGSVLKFQKRLGGQDYTYAALKIKDFWYLTSRVVSRYDGKDFDQFMEDATNIELAQFIPFKTNYASGGNVTITGGSLTW